MLLIIYKFIAAILIFIVSLFSVLYPLRRHHTLGHSETSHVGEAIASGVFLGAAFFHMLPDALRLFPHVYPTIRYPVPELVCLFGFMLMLFLERLSRQIKVVKSEHAIPYVLALILVIHALTEGIALGIGVTITEATILFLAIFAHKGSESFALCVMLLRYGLTRRQVYGLVLFFVFMTPVGIGIGALVNAWNVGGNGQLTASFFNSFAAGTFLYISTLHHIEHKHDSDKANSLLDFMYMGLGMCAMAIVAFWS